MNFMPHGVCMRWDPWLLGLHVGSDLIIAISYFSIPFALIYFIRKRSEIKFRWIFVCFAAFILSCGITHLAAIDAIWSANYWLEGYLKLACAVISAYTAYVLWPIIPKALKIPSPQDLEKTNAALAREVETRKRAQQDLEKLNNELEDRVRRRTDELEKSLKDLNDLRGHFTTVCAWTKRIKDHGEWISFEEFLTNHLGIPVTHGISEEAMRQMEREFPELEGEVRKAMDMKSPGEDPGDKKPS